MGYARNAEQALVEQEFERAKKIARTWPGVPAHADRDALESAAMEGLVNAARTWEPSASPFRTWAAVMVRFAILDSLRASDHLPRKVRKAVGSAPGAQDARDFGVVVDVRAPISLSTTVDEDDDLSSRIGSLESGYRTVEDRHVLLGLLRGLTDREVAIVLLRYFGGYSAGEIGGLFNISESRISQIHRRACDNARNLTADERGTKADSRADADARRANAPVEVTKTEAVNIEDTLSPREKEVFAQLAGGLNNSEIAARLFISVETVKDHIKNIRAKLGAKSRTHAVVRGLQLGLITVADP